MVDGRLRWAFLVRGHDAGIVEVSGARGYGSVQVRHGLAWPCRVN
jgi:hypothetical protein